MKKILPVLLTLLFLIPLAGQSREQLFDQGMGAYQDKLYEAALTSFTSYLDKYYSESRADAALYLSGVSQYNLKRYTGSLATFQQLIKDKPDSPYLRRTPYWIGLNYYVLQDWSRAESAFKNQLVYEGESYFVDRSYLYLGVLAEKKNSWQEAADFYGALLRRGAGTDLVTQGLYRQGLALINLADYEGALYNFERLSADYGSSPYSKAVPYYIGYCYFQLGQYDQARRRFNLYLTLFPMGEYREAVLFQLAQLEKESGNGERSAELLTEIRNNYPNGAYERRTRNMQAENLSNRGEEEQAREIWRALLATETSEDEKDRLRYNIGLSLEKSGQNQEAAELYKSCLAREESPVRMEALDSLSILYREKDPQLALGYAKSLFDDYPQNPEREKVGILAATLMIEQDRKDLIEGHLKQMVDLYGSGENNDIYLMMLGQNAMERKEWTSALTYLGRLVRVYPGSLHYLDALYRLGYIYVLRQEYIRGAGYFEELLESGVPLTEEIEEDSRFSLALCHYKAGNNSRAIELFLDYLEHYDRTGRSGEIALYLGDLHFESREWDKAAVYYEMARQSFENKSDSRQEEALFRQALSLQKNNEPDRAGDLFLELTETYPDSPFAHEALYQAGLCRTQEEKYQEAKELFIESLDSKDPKIREITLYQLVKISLLTQNRSEAVRYLNRMKSDYPQSDLGVNLLFSEAQDYWTLGEYSLAREWYLLCLELFPEKSLTLQAGLRAAQALSELGEREEAVKELTDQLLKGLEKGQETALYGTASALGNGLRLINQPDLAKNTLDTFIPLTSNPHILAPLVLAVKRTGAQLNDLPRYLTMIYEEDTLPLITRTEALLLLAGIKAEEGKKEEAQALYRVVMESDRGEWGSEAHYHLAELIAADDQSLGAQEFLNVSYNYPKEAVWASKALYRAWEIYTSLEGGENKAQVVKEKLLKEYPQEGKDLFQ
jgi:TolA-binding protein